MLIVEDELLVAVEVEAALLDAGYDVSGIATSEAEALTLADARPPSMAVVDVRLSPGDGKRVARKLSDRFDTTILMATSDNGDGLEAIGASCLLPKRYDAELVPPALEAADTLSHGGKVETLPDHMERLLRD